MKETYLMRFIDKYEFGCFKVKEARFPRLLFGTSPFIGAGQFWGRSMRYYREFYLNPANITRLYGKAILKGLNAIHVPSDPVIIDAVNEAMRVSRTESFVLATIEVQNLQGELDLCRRARADSVLTHGSYTDLVGEGLDAILGRVKRELTGVSTGIATHNPGLTIPRTWEVEGVDVILAPINATGEFMGPDVEAAVNAVSEARRRGRRVIAMKSLAAGALNPVEAFEYIVDKVDGVAVGVTSEREMEEILEAGSQFFP